MSFYQSLKIQLSDWFYLSRDGFHIFLGFAVFLITNHLLRIKLDSWKAIIAPFVFAVILELLDLRDALVYGLEPDPIDSLKDIIVTNLTPFVLILYLRRASKSQSLT